MTDREEAGKKLIEQHEKMFQNSTLKERQAAAEFLEHFADGITIEDTADLRLKRNLAL